MDETNPTARALRALQLLQDAPGISAQALGDRLGVSDRAARRYVAVLREAGVPVESVRGPYGGYRVGRGVRLPPLLFTTAEALGLVMAVLDGHRDAADDADPVGQALGKLLRALPSSVARQAEAMRATIAPAPDRSAVRPDPGITTTLVEVCGARRRARIGYRTEGGSPWSADVDPWALVVRHGRWYLLCWSHAAGARRAYRVDRVTSVESLEATFEPPSDLDPVADLEDHLAVGWEHDVEVLVEAPVDRLRRCLPRTLGRLEPVTDDRTRLVGSTSDPTWYAEQLARIPAAYRIVGSPAVRDSARELARRMLASVDQDGPGA